MGKQNQVEAYKNPLAIDITKPDERKKVKVKEIVESRATQVRDRLSTGHEVELSRVEDMRRSIQANVAAKKEPMDGFDPIKLMLVEDMPGHKGTPVYVSFDGKHTTAAAELEKVPELKALIWKGTFAQAKAAAATAANREHTKNGAPLTFDDKKNAAWLFRKALEDGEIPKKDWPSAREAAEMFGISRTYINDENVFDTRRAGSLDGETKKAKKKSARTEGNGNGVVAAGREHLEGKPKKGEENWKHYEVKEKDTGKAVAWYKAATPADALTVFKEAEKKAGRDAKLTDYVTREYQPDPKPGSEKSSVVFDWNKVETDFGSVCRGFDSAAEIFNFKKRPEFKNARAGLTSFIQVFNALKKEFAGKKKSAGESGTAEPKKTETPKENKEEVAAAAT